MSSWEGGERHSFIIVQENGLTTSVKRLLSIRNINVNVKDDGVWSYTIALCCRNGHIEIARLLLQNGADVNVKTIMAQLLSIGLHFKATLTSFISLLRMVLILKHKTMMAGEHCIGGQVWSLAFHSRTHIKISC
jgi:hypothetical protein